MQASAPGTYPTLASNNFSNSGIAGAPKARKPTVARDSRLLTSGKRNLSQLCFLSSSFPRQFRFEPSARSSFSSQGMAFAPIVRTARTGALFVRPCSLYANFCTSYNQTERGFPPYDGSAGERVRKIAAPRAKRTAVIPTNMRRFTDFGFWVAPAFVSCMARTSPQ